jgi:hypothetical protein
VFLTAQFLTLSVLLINTLYSLLLRGSINAALPGFLPTNVASAKSQALPEFAPSFLRTLSYKSQNAPLGLVSPACFRNSGRVAVSRNDGCPGET